MPSGTTRILLIAPGLATFVEKDQKTLQKIGLVDTYLFSSGRGPKLLLSLAKQFIQLLIGIRKYDHVYIWFADYHSFIPIIFARLWQKKSMIVLGGTDVNCIPELGYGYCRNPIRKFMTEQSIRGANLLLPVDDSLGNKVKSKYGLSDEKVVVLYTGFDSEKWFCNTSKQKSILTVGAFGNLQRLKIKGIDMFVEVARLLPQYQFILVRAYNDAEKLLSPPKNVYTYTNRLEDEELRMVFSQAKIYAQFSLTEGLPSSVCEAMLCECIPIGMDVGGMKTAIGDTGQILTARDLQQAADRIQSMMELPQENGLNARSYIMERFNMERRETKLQEILA